MKTRPSAFTLIELIVVIGIISILVGVSAPSFRTFTLNSRLNLSRDLIQTELTNAFSSARSTRDLHRVYGEVSESEVVAAVCSRTEVCTDPVDPDSCEYQYSCEDKETIILEPGIFVGEDFQVDYVPPHGEVVFNEDENQDVLVIQIENGFDQRRGIGINKISGRIQPLLDGEIDDVLNNVQN